MKSLNDFDCILLIDDDPVINYISNRFLRKTGYGGEVLHFECSVGGFEYVEAVVKHLKPEPCSILVFLDLNMPVMNGWDFLEKFEGLPAETKEVFRIVILSSSVSALDINRAKDDRNVCGYVVKPLSIFELGKVEAYLEALKF